MHLNSFGDLRKFSEFISLINQHHVAIYSICLHRLLSLSARPTDTCKGVLGGGEGGEGNSITVCNWWFTRIYIRLLIYQPKLFIVCRAGGLFGNLILPYCRKLLLLLLDSQLTNGLSRIWTIFWADWVRVHKEQLSRDLAKLLHNTQSHPQLQPLYRVSSAQQHCLQVRRSSDLNLENAQRRMKEREHSAEIAVEHSWLESIAVSSFPRFPLERRNQPRMCIHLKYLTTEDHGHQHHNKFSFLRGADSTPNCRNGKYIYYAHIWTLIKLCFIAPRVAFEFSVVRSLRFAERWGIGGVQHWCSPLCQLMVSASVVSNRC